MSARVPPGRNVIAANSASRCVFSTRAAVVAVRVLVSVVNADNPVRVDAVLLLVVAVKLGGSRPNMAGRGSRCASGMLTQLFDKWKVPRFKSCIIAANVGTSTP